MACKKKTCLSIAPSSNKHQLPKCCYMLVLVYYISKVDWTGWALAYQAYALKVTCPARNLIVLDDWTGYFSCLVLCMLKFLFQKNVTVKSTDPSFSECWMLKVGKIRVKQIIMHMYCLWVSSLVYAIYLHTVICLQIFYCIIS